MPNQKFILGEINRALQKRGKGSIIDLDEKILLNFDYTVITVKDLLATTGPNIPPNRWSYYRIYLFTKGHADFQTGIYKFRARKNTLLAVPPRGITSSTNWSSETDGYIGVFNTDFFLKLGFPFKHINNKQFFKPSVKPYIHASGEQAEEIGRIFRTIIKENSSTDKDKTLLIALKFFELLVLYERLYSEVPGNAPGKALPNFVKKFTDLVESHFTQEHSVKFYAQKLHVHPNRLNAIIKQHTEITAKDSIQNRLLLEAKYLLHITPLSVKEISHKLGFINPNYFAVFFKRAENISPASYRLSFL